MCLQYVRVTFMAIVISSVVFLFFQIGLYFRKYSTPSYLVLRDKVHNHIPTNSFYRFSNERFENLEFYCCWSVNMWNAFKVDYMKYTLVF